MRRFLSKISRKSRSVEDGTFFEKLVKILGFEPKDLQYYKKAFTHRSANKLDASGIPFNYERLEFLGNEVPG